MCVICTGSAIAFTGITGDCVDSLDEAEELYRTGNFDQSIEITIDCLEEDELPEEETLRAYRLLGLSYIAQDILQEARWAISRLLEIVPDFEPDPVQDPPTFSRLVEDVREEKQAANNDTRTGTPYTAESMRSFQFGVRGGINFAQLRGDLSDALGFDLDTRNGFAIGMFLSIPLGSSFALQPEAMYSMKGASAEIQNLSVTYIFDYLEIPVFAKYSVILDNSPVSPHFYAGPSLGISLDSTLRLQEGGTTQEEDLSDEIKATDFGLVFGAGADIRVGVYTLGIGLRYGFSLDSIADIEEDIDIQNSVFSITFSIGY